MNCPRHHAMPEIWAVIIGAIVLLVLYGVVASRLRAKKQRREREKVLPYVDEAIHQDRRYHVVLSDGRRFADVRIVGASEPGTGLSFLSGWESMLVLMPPTGKKVYVRQSAVRMVEEA